MTDDKDSNRLSGSFDNTTNTDQREFFALTGFRRDLLRAIRAVQLSDRPPKGLEIKDQLEEWYPGPVHHGRLYPNLDYIREEGLIEKTEIDKRTNAYTLTRKGAQLLASRVRLDASDLRIASKAAAANIARADGGEIVGEPLIEPGEEATLETPEWRDLDVVRKKDDETTGEVFLSVEREGGKSFDLEREEIRQLAVMAGFSVSEPGEKTASTWIGGLSGLRVRDPGPDADGPILELHGDEAGAATEITEEAFVDGLTHAAAELQSAIDEHGLGGEE